MLFYANASRNWATALPPRTNTEDCILGDVALEECVVNCVAKDGVFDMSDTGFDGDE